MISVWNTLLLYVFDFKIELMLLLLLVVYVAQQIRRRPKIPGPFPWPVIGNVASLGSQPQLSMQAMARKYGAIYLMKLGGVDVLVLNDYECIREALGKQRGIFEGRPQFKSFANISQGKGIVFNSPLTQGTKWHQMKKSVVRHIHKFITSADTRHQLSDHIRKESVELVDKLCRQGSGVIEPETTINVSVANVVCAFMFGHRYEYENEEFQELVSLNRQFGDVVGAGSQIDVMPWIKVFPSMRKAMKTFHFLTDRFNSWMKLRTSEHRKSYVHGVTRDLVDTFTSESVARPTGLLKDDVITALTSDVFGAAQDTLSTSLQWVLTYMMYFPDVQKKIQEELDCILGEHRLPDISDVKSFSYTSAVMHEIFRHSTFSSSTIPHTTITDTELKGFKIPKGMLVFINQYAANHDPRHWEDPDQFRPERFLDGNGKLKSGVKDSYLLFSFGSRKCPGDELSRMLVLHMMTNILHLAEFKSDPNDPVTLEGVYNLSMRPKSLRTQILIRKPDFHLSLMQTLSQFSPHVSTVNTHGSSFTSRDIVTDQSQSVRGFQNATSRRQPASQAGYAPKNFLKSSFSQDIACKDRRYDMQSPVGMPTRK